MVFSRNAHASEVLEEFWSQSLLGYLKSTFSASHSLFSCLAVALGDSGTKTEFNWGDFGKTTLWFISMFHNLQVEPYAPVEHLWPSRLPALGLGTAFCEKQNDTEQMCLSPLWYTETSNPLSSPLFYLLSVTWICVFLYPYRHTLLAQVMAIYSPDVCRSFLTSGRVIA